MAKMTHCKTCGAEIAKNAKVCPHCGAKNKKSLLPKVLLALVVLGIIGSLMPGGKKNEPNTPGTATVSETAASSENAAPSGAAASPENAAASEKNDASKAPADAPSGVTPELKEFLDEYEEYMNSYCYFMENYDANDFSALAEYAKMVQQYAEFIEKMDALDETEMSDADLVYYMDVQNRVNKRLLALTDQ